jgi:twitching motility protein PilT
LDVFPTGDKPMARTMLAGSLQGIVSQKLLSRAGGSGRVAAFEILVGTNAVRNLIRENQVPQIYSMIQTGSRYGMITMDEYVRNLLEQGAITKDEARAALIEVTEEVEEKRDTDYAAAGLGGGKVKPKEIKVEPQTSSNEGSYSF